MGNTTSGGPRKRRGGKVGDAAAAAETGKGQRRKHRRSQQEHDGHAGQSSTLHRHESTGSEDALYLDGTHSALGELRSTGKRDSLASLTSSASHRSAFSPTGAATGGNSPSPSPSSSNGRISVTGRKSVSDSSLMVKTAAVHRQQQQQQQQQQNQELASVYGHHTSIINNSSSSSSSSTESPRSSRSWWTGTGVDESRLALAPAFQDKPRLQVNDGIPTELLSSSSLSITVEDMESSVASNTSFVQESDTLLRVVGAAKAQPPANKSPSSGVGISPVNSEDSAYVSDDEMRGVADLVLIAEPPASPERAREDQTATTTAETAAAASTPPPQVVHVDETVDAHEAQEEAFGSVDTSTSLSVVSFRRRSPRRARSASVSSTASLSFQARRRRSRSTDAGVGMGGGDAGGDGGGGGGVDGGGGGEGEGPGEAALEQRRKSIDRSTPPTVVNPIRRMAQLRQAVMTETAKPPMLSMTRSRSNSFNSFFDDVQTTTGSGGSGGSHSRDPALAAAEAAKAAAEDDAGGSSRHHNNDLPQVSDPFAMLARSGVQRRGSDGGANGTRDRDDLCSRSLGGSGMSQREWERHLAKLRSEIVAPAQTLVDPKDKGAQQVRQAVVGVTQAMKGSMDDERQRQRELLQRKIAARAQKQQQQQQQQQVK